MEDIETILEVWTKEDSKIDDTELAMESINIPMLHGKYLKYYHEYKSSFNKLKIKSDKLKQILKEYYRGDLNNPEDLKIIGREPYPKTVLRQELYDYVENDEEYIKLKNKLTQLEEAIEILEQILKSINVRNFAIKNAIDFLKFTNGVV